MDLSALGGGGGGFKASFFSANQQVPIGSTGDIITIVPPIGKKVMLSGLSCAAFAGGSEPGISILIGNKTVVSDKNLTSGTTSNSNWFAILKTQQSSSTVDSAGYIDYLLGDTDEVIVINKMGGDTSKLINYSYAYGE